MKLLRRFRVQFLTTLALTAVVALGLAACTQAASPAEGQPGLSQANTGGSYLDITGLRALGVNVGGDQAFEATGQVVEYTLTAQQVEWELTSGVVTSADTLNGAVPGPTIRVTEGDTLRVVFTNELPQPATIHWHGLHIANEMDGVADLTQRAVMPGETFVYEFVVSHAGTFMYHSHSHNSAEQIDRGLYGFLIVDPQEEPSVQFDREYFMALQGWMVGHGGPMMGGMMDPAIMMEMSGQLESMRQRMDEMAAEMGQMDQWMRESGMPMQDMLQQWEEMQDHMGDMMGELWEMGRQMGDTQMPPPDLGQRMAGVGGDMHRMGRAMTDLSGMMHEMMGMPGGEDMFRRMEHLGQQMGEMAWQLEGMQGRLGGQMEMGGMAHDYNYFTINGKAFPDTEPYVVSQGDLVRVRIINPSQTIHPMHLHGHDFLVVAQDGHPIPPPQQRVLNTLTVNPGETYDIAFIADNPGRWVFHCHELHHAANDGVEPGGLVVLVEYQGYEAPDLGAPSPPQPAPMPGPGHMGH